jgi:hypothetical protein
MKVIGLVVALGALAACSSAEREPAPESEATAIAVQTCPQFKQEADDGAPSRPEVPARLASFVTATETTVTVARNTGMPACIDITYGEIDAWDSFAQGRLLGVGISGHEYNSYLVVDRHGAGEPIETGRAPVFSPSGKRFASVDVSEAAFGAFEALGVWELAENSIRNLVTIEDLLDRGYDWRSERWASDECVAFSTAADPTGIDLTERRFHELWLTDQPELQDVAETAACRSPA